MEEIIVSNNIIIDEVDETLERLRQFADVDSVEINDIVDFINKEENTLFYLDEKLNIKNDNERGIKYLWLDTGLESSKDSRPLFISLIYQDGYYVGHYMGDWKFLSGNISQYFPSNTRTIRTNLERFIKKYEKRIQKREQKHITQLFIEEDKEQAQAQAISAEPKTEIAKQILAQNITIQNIQEDNDNTASEHREMNEHIPPVPREITTNVMNFLMINNWKSIDGLDRYIKVIGCRLQQLVDQNKTDYYILNNIKSAVINTGLLNQFGADIHILYRYHVNHNVYVAYKIMESKTEYLENGFTKDQISQDIIPISFFDKGQELFVATMDDFDVNHRSLLHIIEERRERFPENVRELSANMIATKINNALDLGLKMQKRDRNYAKPCYSSKCKTISWMMPLHINRELTEEPELVLVIRKNKEFYEIKTIIPYGDEMKDRITALALYDGLW